MDYDIKVNQHVLYDCLFNVKILGNKYIVKDCLYIMSIKIVALTKLEIYIYLYTYT